MPVTLTLHDSQYPARLAERTSVAVLPFKNLSPDAGQDFFSDGITEDIINALGRFANLLVAAKSASFQFKGRNVSPDEARLWPDTTCPSNNLGLLKTTRLKSASQVRSKPLALKVLRRLEVR